MNKKQLTEEYKKLSVEQLIELANEASGAIEMGRRGIPMVGDMYRQINAACDALYSKGYIASHNTGSSVNNPNAGKMFFEKMEVANVKGEPV